MLICHNLYGEVSFQVLYPSFHVVEFHIFQNIYICGCKSFIRYVICRYFLSIVTWSFLVLFMSLAEQNFFNLIKSNLSIFSCIDCALVWILRILCLISAHKHFLLCFFFPRSFIYDLFWVSLWIKFGM